MTPVSLGHGPAGPGTYPPTEAQTSRQSEVNTGEQPDTHTDINTRHTHSAALTHMGCSPPQRPTDGAAGSGLLAGPGTPLGKLVDRQIASHPVWGSEAGITRARGRVGTVPWPLTMPPIHLAPFPSGPTSIQPFGPPPQCSCAPVAEPRPAPTSFVAGPDHLGLAGWGGVWGRPIPAPPSHPGVSSGDAPPLAHLQAAASLPAGGLLPRHPALSSAPPVSPPGCCTSRPSSPAPVCSRPGAQHPLLAPRTPRSRGPLPFALSC